MVPTSTLVMIFSMFALDTANVEAHQVADVYYATKMADRFTLFAAHRKSEVDQMHEKEQTRLQEAIQSAPDLHDKSVLEVTETRNEESRLESQNALNEMLNFVTTLKQAMGARGSAVSCLDLTCGMNAICQDSMVRGARCTCIDGYEGDGFVCNPPSSFMAHALFEVSRSPISSQVADIHVSLLHGGTVAVLYRDISRQHRGYMMLGKPDATTMRWTPPSPFSKESQAFGPTLVQLRNSTAVAIAYRDQNRGGSGILHSGVYDPSRSEIRMGALRAFAKHQAQGVTMVPLPDSRLALLYSEHVLQGPAKLLAGGAMYGTAVLARVHGDGSAPELFGKHRFLSGPVSRLTSTMLSPTSFVVAYRQGDTTSDGKKAEASCILANLIGTELVFHPKPLSLEPEMSQMWARSLALIQDNTFTYTYHSGNEKKTKQAVIHADPRTHDMTLLQKPTVISEGFTPFVGTVSTSAPLLERDSKVTSLLQKEGPRLFTYYNSDGTSNPRARMCKVARGGLPSECRELDWARRDLSAAAGTPLADGRMLFVFTDARGIPFYQFVGLLEPDL